jgi:hypothetical protein
MSDKPSDMRLCLYPSDKNGCGMLRTIIPFNYFSAKLDWDVTCLYQFVFDLNLILRTTNYLRFQRQCTENQFTCIREYKKFIDQHKAATKLVYELDDLVHGIEPHNILAYQFYTPIRKQHVVDIMKMCEKVTFSTQFLKDFYLHNFGVTNSHVVPNFLPKFMWNPNFNDNKRPNKTKPVVVWGGSSSHVGPGGDLEFLLPMIEATMDEFQWTFVGVLPPRFFDPSNPQKLQSKYEGKISFYPWQPFYDFPSMMQTIKADIAIAPITDSVFNLAKSDLKYLEYSAMNIPSICSSIGNKKGPYDLIKAPNLVENDVDVWYQAIKELSKDETKKQKTIEIQQQHVNGRWLENPENIEVYKKVYC